MIGLLPVQVPCERVSVWPSRVVPVIAGATLTAGGTPATTALRLDGALEVLTAFVAVTMTRMREPMSAAVSEYVDAVAPAMSVQSSVVASQRCQR